MADTDDVLQRIAIALERIADAMTEPHLATRECEECGRLFIPADPRQRFHAPTCAAKVRKRRFKEKCR